MKPEPLKGKGYWVDEECMDTEKYKDGDEPYEGDILASKNKDIKSAVEWLRTEMFKLFGHETGGTMGEIDYVIDKAFEDVTNERR